MGYENYDYREKESSERSQGESRLEKWQRLRSEVEEIRETYVTQYEVTETVEVVEEQKVLTVSEDSASTKWERGLTAIDTYMDSYREGLREKGITNEEEIKQMLAKERNARMNELANDIGF